MIHFCWTEVLVRCDVVIIGAGVSGLACEAALSRQGISATIFEARDVIGGRSRTHRPPAWGPAHSFGAQGIHPAHKPLGENATHGTPDPKSPPSERESLWPPARTA